MIKNIYIIMLSLSLSLSIVAPSLIMLFDLDTTSIAMVEITEEEHQKKSGNQQDNNKYIQRLYSDLNYLFSKKKTNSYNYSEEISSNYFFKIHLPPPEILA